MLVKGCLAIGEGWSGSSIEVKTFINNVVRQNMWLPNSHSTHIPRRYTHQNKIWTPVHIKRMWVSHRSRARRLRPPLHRASPLNTLRRPASPPHLWTRNLLALPPPHRTHRHLRNL